jgi:dihydroxyacetone kinase-like protein
MKADLLPLLAAMAHTIGEHADELTALDQAIGDADHGVNMRRGFEEIGESLESLAGLPPGQQLQKAGMTLVMTVGGASGPLFGSLFMATGKALPDAPALADLAGALHAGVQSVKQRGRSDEGDKTMLDVLGPVARALAEAAARNDPPDTILVALRTCAAAGLEATRGLRARKGRASYLGERSIGHLDPGARSSALLIETVCRKLGGES